MTTFTQFVYLTLLFGINELVSQTSRESQITLPSGHRIDRSLELFQQRRHPRLRFKLKCHFVGNQSEHTQIEWYKFAPSSTHKLLKVFTNDTAGSSSGELGFDVENANDLSAIYMCRLNDSVSTNQQLIQQVYINELVESPNKKLVKLNYSIIQLTSQRVVLEVYSLDRSNETFKLVYTLINLNSSLIVMRGAVEFSNSRPNLTSSNFLILEALASSTNYTLLIYLKTSQITFLAATETFSTLSMSISNAATRNKPPKTQSAFQLVNKKLTSTDYNTNEDDYDYQEEDEDYDENYEYTDSESGEMSRDERIVSCQTGEPFTTINYSVANLNKLINRVLHKANPLKKTLLSDLTSDFKNFKNLFNLHNFDQSSLNYAVYYECSKQLTQLANSKSQLLLRPLCLLNLGAVWSSFLNNEVSKRASLFTDELFNVQIGLELPAKSTVYVASACQQQKQTSKIVTIPVNTTSYFNSSTRQTPLPNRINSTTNTTQPAVTTSPRTSERFQPLVQPNQLQPPNVSECVILNENELKIRIEHSGEVPSRLKYSNGFTRIDAPSLIYYIEIEVPPGFSETTAAVSDDDQLNRKFFIKKEKDIQVISLNLFEGKFKLEELEDEHLDIRHKLRMRRSVESKSRPLLLDLSAAESVSSELHKIVTFNVKIKLFSENTSHSSAFNEIHLDCKQTLNDSIEEQKTDNYASYSKLGLLMIIMSTLILLVSGLFFCFVIKRKFGLSPEYFLNLKNSIWLKTNNRNGSSNNNLSSIHSSVLNLRKTKSQQQHYQLPFSLSKIKNESNALNSQTILSSNYSYSSTTHQANMAVNIKNPMFNLNYEDIDSIDVDLFEMYVQKMHVDGDFGFVQLYEEITNAIRSYMFSSEYSLLECNKCKNRYSNILAYDHSRVILSHDEKDESSSYINANYVNGYQKPNAYIATQGPMPNTFADFWKMMWEKNCSIICMITNVLEKGRVKCDQYWPDEGFKQYGAIQVTHLQTISLAFYTKRVFTIKLKNSGKKRCNAERLVHQFHFTDWPDHGVPYYIMPVLAFIKQSARANPEMAGPIVVHCSAGVGRTGTYIVIEAMMKQILDKSTVNIHSFLKHIRHQRNYLVQTEEQFIFIYDVILESIKSGETELTEANYKAYINSLTDVLDEHTGLQLIGKQFELITEFKPRDWQVSFAQLHYNLNKNRSDKYLPVNNSRVILSRKPGVEGSDYINASYLHGCSRQDEFIITQYPMAHTKSAFWQMVWDNNSNQIVVLNADDTEQCEIYWSPLGEPMKCDSFTVTLKDENFDIDFVIRDFQLTSLDEDYEFNCHMISACYWPESCAPIKASFDLINKVRLYRAQCLAATTMAPTASTSLNAPPIIVHDLYGGSRAASFCALYTFQDLMLLENTVNVYEVAKMFHLKRPDLWNHQSNIMFLYKAVECLFEEMSKSNSRLTHVFTQHLAMNTHMSPNKNSSLTLINYKSSSFATNSHTLTLPNIANYGGQQLVAERRHLSNDAIGHRLHNFQQHIQRNRDENTDDSSDPTTTTPLTPKSKPIESGIKIIAPTPSVTPKVGFSISGLPRLLKPSFFTTNSSTGANSSEPNDSNHINLRRSFMRTFDFSRRSNEAKQTTATSLRSSFGMGRNTKAAKFVNSMKTKSASFKRVLFPRFSASPGDQQPEQNTASIIELASPSEISNSASSESSNNIPAIESSLSSKSALIGQSSSQQQLGTAVSHTSIVVNTRPPLSQSKEKLTSII